MKRLWPWLLTLLLLAQCTSPTPLPDPATLLPPAEPQVTPSPEPTPTLDYSAPEIVGTDFLRAWEVGDYARMYALLAPTLTAGLAPENFERAYRSALNTTTTLTVSLELHQLGVETGTAWIDFDQTWETALFGTLSASNRLNLIEEGGEWWVDWRREAIWPELAGGHSFGVDYQVPPRANIYDRTGAGLAVPTTIVTVGVIPNQIADEGALLDTLSPILNMTPEHIRGRYEGQPAHWFIPLADITGDQSLAHNEALSLPGIERRERPGRLYPLDGAGAHVVGWVSPIPAESIDTYLRRGYRADAWVGISGLEAWGERILAGSNGGRLYLVDANGAYLRGLAERSAERGRALYTTLDRSLQQAAEEIIGQRRGAIVALEVETGAILALTSGPGFDNNLFIRPTDATQRLNVINHPDRPLLNRALQGTYPCGSTFKIVTMAAGLETGIVLPTTPFSCPGYWDGLGEMNRKRCWGVHGTIDLQDGLTESCNVVFYEVGAALNRRDPESLATFGAAFGLGEPTGLRELRETGGLMPTPQWKLDTYFEPWASGDAVNLAIGQGYLLVTPLQIARMGAAIANGGTLYRPYLIQSIAAGPNDPEQVTQPEALSQIPLSPAHLQTIRQAMLAVTTAPNGTANHRFQGLEVPVAGKTGTAETGGPDPHSWFVGYFPADNPQVAAVVMVENAGEGSTVAAPMFRQFVEAYYGLARTPLPPPPTPTPVPEIEP